MRQYSLVTEWRIEAPIGRVWDALSKPEVWPSWWRYVESVTDIEPGDARGVGALRRYTWSSRLPYRLSFDMRTTALEEPYRIEGIATGDLNGTGQWRLRESATTTRVTYLWTVRTDKAWMNLLAPILAPVFAWNHNEVMREGGRGLAHHLGVPLREFAGSGGSRA
jgi:uncharacterized protein YndB with AHSA1/START domain